MSLKTKNEIEIVGRERLTPALDLAKKFVKKGFAQPVLERVNLTPDGNLQATDSHKFVIFKDVHSYTEEICINLQTLNIERGWTYPSLSERVLPNDTPLGSVRFKRNALNELITILKFYKNKYISGHSKNHFVSLTITQEQIKFNEWRFEMKYKSEESFDYKGENPITFKLNADYLITAFETFLSYSNDEEIEMKYYGPHRILIFENDDFIIGVLPVRTFDGDQNG